MACGGAGALAVDGKLRYNDGVIGASPIGVSSEHFIADMAAGDLQGGDEKYVQWAGEYQMMARLDKEARSPVRGPVQ